MEEGTATKPAGTNGPLATTAAVKIASGECLPLQHRWPGLGDCGEVGADSWQPV